MHNQKIVKFIRKHEETGKSVHLDTRGNGKKKLPVISLMAAICISCMTANVTMGAASYAGIVSNGDTVFTGDKDNACDCGHESIREITKSLYGTKISSEGSDFKSTNDDEHSGHRELTILAAGDNLIHSSVYNKFRVSGNRNTGSQGGYDFNPLYDNVREFIKSYDIAVINQETIFVHNEASVSTYPCFGTPEVMGHALVNAGFDVVLSATNHTWDKGEAGVRNMLRFWKEEYPDIPLLGIHGTQEDADQICYLEKNGIKAAMFNYTYGLNGFKLPKDGQYLVDLLADKEKFLLGVREAENNADITICFLHIGEEYLLQPTKYQREYAESLIDAGADIIICAHPHVIEPYGIVKTPAGNSGLVYWSCGNFVSGQNQLPRVLGGMASIRIVKDINGELHADTGRNTNGSAGRNADRVNGDVDKNTDKAAIMYAYMNADLNAKKGFCGEQGKNTISNQLLNNTGRTCDNIRNDTGTGNNSTGRIGKAGQTYVKDFGFVPVVMHQGREYRVYLLADYTPQMAAGHRLGLTTESLWALWKQVTGEDRNEAEHAMSIASGIAGDHKMIGSLIPD